MCSTFDFVTTYLTPATDRQTVSKAVVGSSIRKLLLMQSINIHGFNRMVESNLSSHNSPDHCIAIHVHDQFAGPLVFIHSYRWKDIR